MDFISSWPFLTEAALMSAPMASGLAQGALDMAVKHVRDRKQFGKPIGSFQGVQFKIADMAVKIELARNVMYKAAWLLDNDTPDTNVTAMAKMYAARIAVEVVDEALQLHGGYGYFDDYDIERFYRAAKVLEIYEGAKGNRKNDHRTDHCGQIKSIVYLSINQI